MSDRIKSDEAHTPHCQHPDHVDDEGDNGSEKSLPHFLLHPVHCDLDRLLQFVDHRRFQLIWKQNARFFVVKRTLGHSSEMSERVVDKLTKDVCKSEALRKETQRRKRTWKGNRCLSKSLPFPGRFTGFTRLVHVLRHGHPSTAVLQTPLGQDEHL